MKILFKRRKQLKGKVLAKAFEIIDWMYSSFPENFNKVLENFLYREQDSQKYWKKMKFEEIFSYKQFREIQTAYESYWIERLANGSRRRHLKMNFIQPVKLKADVGIVSTPLKRQFLFNEFMSNPESDVLLTYIETAQMVGLERRYVNQLVLSGLLKPLSKDGKRYLPRNDILELLSRCCGSLTDDHFGRITIHEAILKYPGQGLSIVKIIILILEGKLIPKSQVQGTVLDTITLSIEEIDKIIIEFKKDRGVA
ncbi:hypothetical protein OB236_01205 [Paenibacillus sp. WQ 127069]|uniref:Uncharacterized protein n=1 Tax=Paenibacillus baimaensis TaxID=2982185 RepID=A0ABT2U973_9BACL|nr:hypothetical protein [Paenibacillus sp. WQ 127069]MCU6790731.1 hypothetical protein [Paenibacillus sp. WQ 127069]